MRRSHRKLGNAFAFSFSFSGRFGDSEWPEAVFNTHIILSPNSTKQKLDQTAFILKKTSQELRMLSRSLSDCKVTVSNSQLVKKLLLIEI